MWRGSRRERRKMIPLLIETPLKGSFRKSHSPNPHSLESEVQADADHVALVVLVSSLLN